MDMYLKTVTNVLENKNVTAVVSLLLALYAGLAAPALPNVVIKFFDTFIGKVLFIFLIAFVASRNVQVAIMLAVAFVVTLNVANKRYAESFMNLERFDSPMGDDDENEMDDGDSNSGDNEDGDGTDDDDDDNEDGDGADNDDDDDDDDNNETFDSTEEEDEEEEEGFANPHAFSSVDENFDNSSELFDTNEDKNQSTEGVLPANNLSGNPSKMYAPF